jgi:cell division protein WhiA
MTSPEPSFTEAVRQELSRRPVDDTTVRAELAALLRLAGSFTLAGGSGGRRLELETTSGAVARRAYLLLQRRFGVRPELWVRAPGGVRRRSTYGVTVPAEPAVVTDLGIVDAAGGFVEAGTGAFDDAERIAYLRGALLAAGSVSAPGRSPHLEIAAHTSATATVLARLVEELTAGHAHVVDGDRARVVVKSGRTILRILEVTGADDAAARVDEQRARRRLRNDANRLANADAANLRRTIEAAAAQVRAVERVVEHLGWEELDPDLRSVALARLANPAASLTELGELIDPPVGKSAVHRRLRRLEALDPVASDGADLMDEPQAPGGAGR